MNILIFSWRDPKHPLAGGAEQVMHEHAKGWIEAGHKVTLFSSRFKGSPKKEDLDGVKIVRSGYQYLGVQLAAIFYYLKKNAEFDFVVDQFHGIPFFTPLYVTKPKLAVIQETPREVWFLNPLPRPLNWVIGTIGYIGEPFVFLFYKRTPFMIGSKSTKEDVAKFGIAKKNITIVSHGVLAKKPKPFPNKNKKKTIVYFGVLSKDKGIEDALRCFSQLNKKGDFRFWVIGNAETDKYMDRLLDMCVKLRIKNKTKFWGYIGGRRRFRLLAKAHVMVNPSVREGWGLVNIEANAMGVPVVAYRSPGLVDSVKDGLSGILCKVNTPEALAKNVFNLLNDESKYKKLKKGAILWSKKFSWRQSKKKSLRLIQKIHDRR